MKAQLLTAEVNPEQGDNQEAQGQSDAAQIKKDLDLFAKQQRLLIEMTGHETF